MFVGEISSLQRAERPSQTWAAVSSCREPKKEVKHNPNGEADIAQWLSRSFAAS
jgi:hypothetical protein